MPVLFCFDAAEFSLICPSPALEAARLANTHQTNQCRGRLPGHHYIFVKSGGMEMTNSRVFTETLTRRRPNDAGVRRAAHAPADARVFSNKCKNPFIGHKKDGERERADGSVE
jgi:hypothetical protein